MVGLGGLTVVLVGVALFRMLDPLLRADAERVEPSSTSGGSTAHQRELEHDKRLVLKAIREIEHDYQMRRIAESDYQELLQRYRARAMRIIRELDAGDNYRTLIEDELKARLAALPPPCPSCGNSNDADAQFCKKCGGKLKEAASS
jgi:zinc-ribbon domain